MPKVKKIIILIVVIIALAICGILGYTKYWKEKTQQKCDEVVSALNQNKPGDAADALDILTKRELKTCAKVLEQSFTIKIQDQYAALDTSYFQNTTKSEAEEYLRFGETMEEKGDCDLQEQNDALRELIAVCEKYASQQGKLAMLACEEDKAFQEKLELASEMMDFAGQLGDASYAYDAVLNLRDYVSEMDLTSKYGTDAYIQEKQEEMLGVANSFVDMYNAMVDYDVDGFQKAKERGLEELDKFIETLEEISDLAQSAQQDLTNVSDEFLSLSVQ